MSKNNEAPKSTHRRRSRRNTRQILKRRIAADSAEPIKLPLHLLWCNTNGSDTVTQWLLHRNLPWWFFASFLNYCARVGDKNHPRHKTRPRYTVAQRRLLGCLRQYPMSVAELIEMMKIYLGGGATWKMLDKGLLISLRELKNDTNHEFTLNLAQSRLNHIIFRGLQHNPYHSTMPYQSATNVDCSSTPSPKLGEESSPVAPTADNTLTLPLRLGSRPSLKTTPEPVEQQLHSVQLRPSLREDDTGMSLD